MREGLFRLYDGKKIFLRYYHGHPAGKTILYLHGARETTVKISTMQPIFWRKR